MAKHDPNRVHWAKVLKVIRIGGTLSQREVAGEMGLIRSNTHLIYAIQQLISQGKIDVIMGRDEEGAVGLLYKVKSEGNKSFRSEEYDGN